MAIYTIEDTTITNIADAIREKNGSTNKYNPSQMPDAIRAIETGGGSSDGWQPQEDWWDIKNIIENDTEDYASKIICLLNDFDDVTTIYRQQANKVVTSDGTEYTELTNSYSHTWDKTQDKKCELGYKTRYIIYYYNSTDVTPNVTQYNDKMLYMIIKDMTFRCRCASGSGTFKSLSLLQSIETINSIFKVTGYAFQGCETLTKFPELQLNENNTNFGMAYSFANACFRTTVKEVDISNFDHTKIMNLSYFSNNTTFRIIRMFDTRNVANFNNAFQNSYYLHRITKLDFNSATNIKGMFQNCTRLRTIDEIANIKITGLNFSQCGFLRKDTLIRILNALYDYASDGSTSTYTLTLGATNLAKLTDEEKAIATNKGWTLN